MENGEFPYGSEEKLREAQIPLALEAIAELESAATEEKEFYALSRAAFAYLVIEKQTEAVKAAERFLKLAESFKENWNYGNAIHNANLVLGICAFDSGDIDAAKEYLEKAGGSPGSPQLGSFGPNMQLARRLLNAAEFDVVLKYFDLCERFWKSGGEWLRVWREKVIAHKVPNFYMHLYT
jgi:tetratricopeptide (TPR) repeat protein